MIHKTYKEYYHDEKLKLLFFKYVTHIQECIHIHMVVTI